MRAILPDALLDLEKQPVEDIAGTVERLKRFVFRAGPRHLVAADAEEADRADLELHVILVAGLELPRQLDRPAAVLPRAFGAHVRPAPRRLLGSKARENPS